MDPFFKHYTPQLAHNCCPCPMNYASRNANPGSLALDKSQAAEEAGVITKTIPGDPEETSTIWSTGHSSTYLSPLQLGFTPTPPAFVKRCWVWSIGRVPSNVRTCMSSILGHRYSLQFCEAGTTVLDITQLRLKYPLLLHFLGVTYWGLGDA